MLLSAKLAFAAECMNADGQWHPGAFRCGGAAGSDIPGAEAVPGKRSSPRAAPCRGGRASPEPPTQEGIKGLFSTHVLPQGTNGPCSAAHAVLITRTARIKPLGRCVHDVVTACRRLYSPECFTLLWDVTGTVTQLSFQYHLSSSHYLIYYLCSLVLNEVNSSQTATFTTKASYFLRAHSLGHRSALCQMCSSVHSNRLHEL